MVIHSLQSNFQKIHKARPEVISQAPGRAEIIGCHTDYNYGYALGAAIDNLTFALVSKRKDNQINVFSENQNKKVVHFKLADIGEKNGNHWTNYVKAVVRELSRKKKIAKGFNLYIYSTVPSSGGVSSSATLELSVGLALSQLYQIKLSRLELSIICQKAENGPLVNSPCGFLDQGTCALAKKDHLLFLDFLPKKNLPISSYSHIHLDLNQHNASFMIVVDKKITRNLGESGYSQRRKSCEESLPILEKLLNKKIESLRDVSVNEFIKCKRSLDKIDHKIRIRVEHIVYENQRVLDGINALKHDNIEAFGKLLTASGKSSLELYELNEGTPELTFLLSKARQINGVIGARNMGGGFSANILILIKKSRVEKFIDRLSFIYRKEYNNNLDFILFNPSAGARTIGTY